MIDVHVLAVKPHPGQATSHPGWWTVQLRVSHAGQSRTFWRWHRVREIPSNDKAPSHDEILARFWGDTFGDLQGFDFRND